MGGLLVRDAVATGRIRCDLALQRRSGLRVWAVVFENLMGGVGGSILGSGLFSLARILESSPRLSELAGAL